MCLKIGGFRLDLSHSTIRIPWSTEAQMKQQQQQQAQLARAQAISGRCTKIRVTFMSTLETIAIEGQQNMQSSWPSSSMFLLLPVTSYFLWNNSYSRPEAATAPSNWWLWRFAGKNSERRDRNSKKSEVCRMGMSLNGTGSKTRVAWAVNSVLLLYITFKTLNQRKALIPTLPKHKLLGAKAKVFWEPGWQKASKTFQFVQRQVGSMSIPKGRSKGRSAFLRCSSGAPSTNWESHSRG